MLLRSTFIVLLCAITSACLWQPVEVIDSTQFKLMADRMPAELEARNILDNDRDYVPGQWETQAVNYGQRLFHHLSTAVIFDENAQDTASTFAASIQKTDIVTHRPHGFTIIQKKRSGRGRSASTTERHLSVDMVAVSDWNGDGKKDWIVACKLLRTKAANPRIYYVVISNPPDAGAFTANTVAVYDDLGVIGRLYMQKSEAASANTSVEEVVPGLKAVTTPPATSASNISSNKAGGVQERSLD